MLSRRVFLGVLIAGVGVGLLMTGPVGAQSVSLGNGVIDVLDTGGDTAVHVDSFGVDIGSTGADADLLIRDLSNNQALWFNTNVSGLYVGGSGSGGEMWLRDTAGQITLQNNSTGDLILGGSTSDGDITVREGTTGRTNFSVDGNTAAVTVGAQGGTGDGGQVYLRDPDGVTNNIWLDGVGGNVALGTSGGTDDGDLDLWDGSGAQGIYMRGDAGQIVNKLTGNGVVKAWARINASGTVASCYRCNASGTATQKLFTGQYEVSFSPLGADIQARPRLAVLDTHSTGVIDGEISLANRSGDNTSIWVECSNSTGIPEDNSFTIVVY